MSIATDMPLLAKQAGIWKGVYQYYDSRGSLVDEHESTLTCTIVDSLNYHQLNAYSWADGKNVIREYAATYSDNRIWFNNDLIKGYAAEDKLDPYNRSILLYWVRKDEPDSYFYEMIQVNDSCTHRTRIWHCFSNGLLDQRVCIREEKQ